MEVASYRDRATGQYPVSMEELRERTPDLGLPAVFDEEAYDLVGADPVGMVAPPEYDAATHTLTEGAPVLVDGGWQQTWVVEALPPVAPTVPASITMRQAKLCLHRAGMLQAADISIFEMGTGIDDTPEEIEAGIEARIEWAFGSDLERYSATVLRVADQLELPAEQVDALFTWAASL